MLLGEIRARAGWSFGKACAFRVPPHALLRPTMCAGIRLSRVTVTPGGRSDAWMRRFAFVLPRGGRPDGRGAE